MVGCEEQRQGTISRTGWGCVFALSNLVAPIPSRTNPARKAVCLQNVPARNALRCWLFSWRFCYLLLLNVVFLLCCCDVALFIHLRYLFLNSRSSFIVHKLYCVVLFCSCFFSFPVYHVVNDDDDLNPLKLIERILEGRSKWPIAVASWKYGTSLVFRFRDYNRTSCPYLNFPLDLWIATEKVKRPTGARWRGVVTGKHNSVHLKSGTNRHSSSSSGSPLRLYSGDVWQKRSSNLALDLIVVNLTLMGHVQQQIQERQSPFELPVTIFQMFPALRNHLNNASAGQHHWIRTKKTLNWRTSDSWRLLRLRYYAPTAQRIDEWRPASNNIVRVQVRVSAQNWWPFRMLRSTLERVPKEVLECW